MNDTNSFYNHQKPYSEDFIDTGDGHELYCACYGNPDGKPIVVLHGGPGYGFDTDSIRILAPQFWNILVFDQRGAGQSKPGGSVENNTTQHLVSDINLFTDRFGLDTFVIKGGSWGTTLALVYAQAYPERIESMILRGVFLGEKNEALICKADGIQRHFPDLWSQFIQPLPEDKRQDPFKAYYQLIFHGDDSDKCRFAREAILLEGVAGGMGRKRTDEAKEIETFDFYSVARIEYHYLMNNYFLEPGQILKNCWKIKDIPISIVHGRYDMICPPESAWRLAEHLDNCELVFADQSGHSETEPITSEIMRRIADKHLRMNHFR